MDRWSLYCDTQGRYNYVCYQYCIRFFDFGSAAIYHLESANAFAKKNRNFCYFLDWCFVSSKKSNPRALLMRQSVCIIRCSTILCHQINSQQRPHIRHQCHGALGRTRNGCRNLGNLLTSFTQIFPSPESVKVRNLSSIFIPWNI